MVWARLVSSWACRHPEMCKTPHTCFCGSKGIRWTLTEAAKITGSISGGRVKQRGACTHREWQTGRPIELRNGHFEVTEVVELRMEWGGTEKQNSHRTEKIHQKSKTVTDYGGKTEKNSDYLRKRIQKSELVDLYLMHKHVVQVVGETTGETVSEFSKQNQLLLHSRELFMT